MKRLYLILIIVMMAVAQSCVPRYTLNGASIDYNQYKTISFGDFPIRAALVYPPLQQTFENRLLDMIQQQTRLRVIDSNNSDMRMEGEITGYNLSPQAVGEDAYASQTRLTISVRVKYINNKNPNLSKDQTFSAYRDFSSSEMLTDVQDELCNQISKDLADLIFNATLGDW
ncbi:MAG: LptE family protein [Bacteroidales bacterium]|uniref:LptE family protein n=1 Tax=Sodaliphilus sp. TaxID=2815818 RepID=UPI001B507013|nr:LptE family protein [Candidatus Sodaliphilus limicaballi]